MRRGSTHGVLPRQSATANNRRQNCRSLADLSADAVFLLVQHSLLGLSNVTAILAGHVTLFLANLMILVMQLGRFALAHLTFFDFVVNTPVLVRQALIHFSASRMVFLPVRFSKGIARQPRKRGGKGGHDKNLADGHKKTP